MDQIEFSIIVTVYNCEPYIKECIESVINQTYGKFELILVDDGSRDNSLKICNEFLNVDSRISVFHKQNEGQLATRLFGIDHASNEFLVFLDSDDTLDKKSLQTIKEYLEEYSPDCLVFGLQRVLDGNVISKWTEVDGKICFSNQKSEFIKKVILNEEYNSVCRKVIKRSLIKDIVFPEEFFSIRHGEDLLQSVLYFQVCNKVLFIPECLYNYRVNANSVQQTWNHSNYRVDFTVPETVYQIVTSNNLLDAKSLNEFQAYLCYLLTHDIEMILRFRVPTRQKIDYFEEIKNTSYYQNILQRYFGDNIENCKKRSIIKLFSNGQYMLLIAVESAMEIARKILLQIRKIHR